MEYLKIAEAKNGKGSLDSYAQRYALQELGQWHRSGLSFGRKRTTRGQHLALAGQNLGENTQGAGYDVLFTSYAAAGYQRFLPGLLPEFA
ncbi:MAG: hypothetical protein LBK63_08085 [Treponema sp.]|nr:hypothetical protein [Treponema sp.]